MSYAVAYVAAATLAAIGAVAVSEVLELNFFWSFMVGASCGMVAGLVFDRVFSPKA